MDDLSFEQIALEILMPIGIFLVVSILGYYIRKAARSVVLGT